MTRARIFHQTMMDGNDLLLESFIVTGAMSGKTRVPEGCVDQAAGFYAYVSLEGAAGTGFLHGIDSDYPFAAVVELHADVTAREWDIDHEMSWTHSQDLLREMKDFFPLLENEELKRHHWTRGMLDALAAGRDDFNVPKDVWPGAAGNAPRDDTPYGSVVATRAGAFLLEQLHFLLNEKFPDDYAPKKQAVLDKLVACDGPPIKYIGAAPLRISRVYGMRIEEARKVPGEQWPVVHDATAPAVENARSASFIKDFSRR